MSTKKRPVNSASFKKSEKSTTQRSRPTSARSNASTRLSASFRSEVSDISGLSVTGIKSTQNKPRQKQSLSSSIDKSSSLPSSQKRNQTEQSFSKSKAKIQKSKAEGDTIIKEQNKNNEGYNPDNFNESFDAEKEDHWWENIPEDINFSPNTSFASSKLTDFADNKSKISALTSSVRNPSLNDFLDFNNHTKTLPDKKPEQNAKSLNQDQKLPRTFPKFDNSDLNFDKVDQVSQKSGGSSKKSSRNSPKFAEISTTPRDLFENDSRKLEKTSTRGYEIFENSEKNVDNLDHDTWNMGSVIVEQGLKNAESFKNAERRMETGDLETNDRKDEWLVVPIEVGKVGSKVQEKAALTIQRYYKGYRTRMKDGHNAVQNILEEKKALREQRMKEEDFLDSSSERQRRREEKARLARHAAIQELNQKREKKKEENKRLVENEMKFLDESGKVIKAKDKATKAKKERKKKVMSNDDVCSVKSSGSERLSRPSTARTLDSKVEELFQGSRSSNVPSESQEHLNENVSEANTSRTETTVKTSDTKTTLEDLFESLRELEKEPVDIKSGKKSDLYEWEQSGSRAKDNESDLLSGKLTLETLRNSGNPNMLSQEKLRSIMSFLDEVEQTDQDTVVSRMKDSPKTFGEASPSVSINVSRVDAEKELALLDSASAAASDVTNAMMSVKVELEEKKKTSEMLQRALNQQREFSLRQARDMEKDAKQRLDLQRQEYEATIQRHLSFIDQLIDDKKILSERCEELVKKLKETDKKYVDKIQRMEESHATEMKKQKDIMTTAEKLRREKWVKEKSQQIKELTVKGLEPDIQKLIAKHKAELKKLKSVNQGELLEADERAGRRYLHQIEELRDQLEREKDTACNRERDLAQTRFQKQMEEEEQSFQQQRRRLYAEIQEEKERMADQAQKQRKELDELKAKLQETHKSSMNNVETSSKRLVEELEQKHTMEMKDLKERLDIEKQQWIENYMKKQDATLLQKERELKEGVRESRDKEIEMVIRRLEEETGLARDECERAAENRIKRVRDKYEAEIKELEKSEKAMHEKYTTIKEQSNEFEEEVSRLKSGFKNEERKMEDLKKLTEHLQSERGQVVDIIRQEFADRLVTTDEDNKRLKIEMSELRAKHRLEMEKTNNLKEEEMEEVHKRVKQAISKKEETLNTLKQQKESAEKRADHLEDLLQQQRKKLLS